MSETDRISDGKATLFSTLAMWKKYIYNHHGQCDITLMSNQIRKKLCSPASLKHELCFDLCEQQEKTA